MAGQIVSAVRWRVPTSNTASRALSSGPVMIVMQGILAGIAEAKRCVTRRAVSTVVSDSHRRPTAECAKGPRSRPKCESVLGPRGAAITGIDRSDFIDRRARERRAPDLVARDVSHLRAIG